MSSFDEALARIERIQSRDGEHVQPACQTQLMSHGQKAKRAIVFFHGFTSCPRQFFHLGEAFFQRGYNVFIPREENHGHADMMTDALVKLSAEKMIDEASRAVDITCALGEQVFVVGLSMGATAAAWIAQNRADVERCVIIAPPFEVEAIPRFIHRLFTQLILAMPVFFVWWDPRLKADNTNRPPYSYPRYPSRALAQNWALAYHIRDEAKKHAPSAKHIVLVTNANDHVIRNSAVVELFDNWKRRAPNRVSHFQFPRELKLRHDMASVESPGQKIDIAYPKLIELIERVEK